MSESQFHILIDTLKSSINTQQPDTPSEQTVQSWKQTIEEILNSSQSATVKEKEEWASLSKSLSEDMKTRGNNHLSNNENDNAVVWFSLAILLDPQNHILYSNRSAAYANLGNYAEALNDAESVVQLDPNWAKGYSRKGLALYFLKKYDEAQEAYKKGLSIDPTNQIITRGLKEVEIKVQALDANEKGEECMAKNKVPEAINYFNKAIDLDASEYLFYANRSEALLKNCNGVGALADAENIIKLYPYWAKAYLRKGDALMYLGRYEEAAAAFSSGIRVDPENSVLQSKLTNAAQEEVRSRQKTQGTTPTANNNSSPKNAPDDEDPKKENRFSRLFSYAKEKLNL